MAYGQPVGGVTSPAADPRLTIRPLRWARIQGGASWHMRIRPNTFVSKVSRTRLSGTSSTGPPPPCPAFIDQHPDRPMLGLDLGFRYTVRQPFGTAVRINSVRTAGRPDPLRDLRLAHTR
jgi:hypothetical protein